MYNKANIIPIVAITDNKLAFAVATLFINLLETKNSDTYLELNVLVSPDFEEENIKKINSIQSDYPNECTIKVIKMDNRMDNIKNGTKHISNACAYKMCLGEMFPHYEKVLYLDSDIYVLKDLTSLYNIDLGNNYIGGCFSYLHYLKQADLKDRLGISDLCSYINAGVMLLNLKKIREDGIEAKMQSLIGTFPDSVDQHIYNKVCYGRIKQLPLKYNVRQCGEELYLNESALVGLTEQEQWEYINDRYIYHYTGTGKPWVFRDIKYSVLWYRNYSKSPYRDIDLNLKSSVDNMNLLQRIFSVKNMGQNKQICILGHKFKIRRNVR